MVDTGGIYNVAPERLQWTDCRRRSYYEPDGSGESVWNFGTWRWTGPTRSTDPTGLNPTDPGGDNHSGGETIPNEQVAFTNVIQPGTDIAFRNVYKYRFMMWFYPGILIWGLILILMVWVRGLVKYAFRWGDN